MHCCRRRRRPVSLHVTDSNPSSPYANCSAANLYIYSAHIISPTGDLLSSSTSHPTSGLRSSTRNPSACQLTATGLPSTRNPTTSISTSGNPTANVPTSGHPATGYSSSGYSSSGYSSSGNPATGNSPTGNPTTGSTRFSSCCRSSPGAKQEEEANACPISTVQPASAANWSSITQSGYNLTRPRSGDY